MSQEPTAAQQLQSLNQALINAFVQKEDAQAKITQADETIRAIRNQLGGIKLGQQVQTDILAEQAASAKAASNN
jgi:exonuclease V gamma subunit